MTRPEDPWRDALDRHVTSSGATRPLERIEPLIPGRGIRVTTTRIVGLAVGLVVLLGAGAYAGYLAVENHDRADRWRDRSVVLQDLVADRTEALNRQTARLNVASTRLREARTAISQSEEDVVQLEARQRELANEKAQVEDERAALLSVAGQLETCNTGMGGLIQDITSGLRPDPAAVADLVSVCNAADAAVSAYVQSYGSE